MGAWGVLPFENDQILDWWHSAQELGADERAAKIVAALRWATSEEEEHAIIATYAAWAVVAATWTDDRLVSYNPGPLLEKTQVTKSMRELAAAALRWNINEKSPIYEAEMGEDPDRQSVCSEAALHLLSQ